MHAEHLAQFQPHNYYYLQPWTDTFGASLRRETRHPGGQYCIVERSLDLKQEDLDMSPTSTVYWPYDIKQVITPLSESLLKEAQMV